ncbi:MAG: EAL domain-containing protein [Anaeroplasmataceae bacterium]
MYYNIYFDISSFFIFMLIIFSVLYRKMNKTKSGILFLVLVIDCAITTIFDLLSVNKYFSTNTVIVFEYLYLITKNFSSLLFCMYLIGLTNSNHLQNKKYLQIIMLLPFIAIIGLLVANIFTDCLFSVSYLENGMRYFSSGSLKIVMYLISSLYLIVGIAYLFIYRKIFKLEKLMSIYIIIPILMTALIWQYFNPNMMVEMLSVSLSLLFLMMTVERPEQILDYESGLKKYSAFFDDSYKAEIIKKETSMILCVNINHNSLKTILSFKERVAIKAEIAKKLKKITSNFVKNADYYSLGNGQFVVALDKQPHDKLYEIAHELRTNLNSFVNVNNSSVELFTNVAIFNCPDDSESTQKTSNIIENFSNNNNLLSDVFDLSNVKNKDRFDIINDIDVILERGFTNNSYEVYYQPIYNLKNKSFNSAEALIRLKDEKYGFIPPSLFIPYAEKSGIIHKIGDYVLEEVCKFIASDKFKELNLKYIEVNLSTIQCVHENLVDKIVAITNKYNVNPNQINLEITETSDAFSYKMMVNNILKLQESGFIFSLDDYGTGYSNMRRISSLPLHIIKIDKSVVDSSNEPKMKEALRHIIQMIKSMDVEIVVEGVETKEAVDLFEKYNCEYIQGYYYSKPVPQEEFIKFVQSNMNIN